MLSRRDATARCSGGKRSGPHALRHLGNGAWGNGWSAWYSPYMLGLTHAWGNGWSACGDVAQLCITSRLALKPKTPQNNNTTAQQHNNNTTTSVALTNQKHPKTSTNNNIGRPRGHATRPTFHAIDCAVYQMTRHVQAHDLVGAQIRAFGSAWGCAHTHLVD